MEYSTHDPEIAHLTGVSLPQDQSKSKTNKISNAFKGIHRRMSSIGKSSKSKKFNSPYGPWQTLPSLAASSKSASYASLTEHLLTDEDRNHDERDTRLFCADKLEIPAKHREWLEAINMAVRSHMNSAEYDASHDYEHIQRVVMNAYILWQEEKNRVEFYNVDPLVIYVAAMVHDIGNAKFGGDNEVVQVSEEPDLDADDKDQERQRDAIATFIKNAAPACPPYIWGPAAHIASLISFTREMHDPEHIVNEAEAYPALQIVQDAERFEALGALGIARACVDGGTQQSRGTGSVRRVVGMVDQDFSRYASFMKTKAGRREAEKKWAVMRRIREEIVEEAYCEDVLEAY